MNRACLMTGVCHCPDCDAPSEDAPICADCGEAKATDPVRRGGELRYCRSCADDRREFWDESQAESRREARLLGEW